MTFITIICAPGGHKRAARTIAVAGLKAAGIRASWLSEREADGDARYIAHGVTQAQCDLFIATARSKATREGWNICPLDTYLD